MPAENITRRDFARGALAVTGLAVVGCGRSVCPEVSPAEGAAYPKWSEGHFQVHVIYTGVGESQFLIFPDGTSMLLDCGDHAAHTRGEKAMPILPDLSRHSGEWIARYVLRVNPRGRDVDYMLLTHYHEDHGGSSSFHAGTAPSGKYVLSGFALAAEQLRFGTAIDRAWPDYTDPIPLLSQPCVDVMRPLYGELVRRGTKVEKFRLEKGSDQIRPLHGPVLDFAVEPLCANGRILLPDGRVHDPLREYFAAVKPRTFNENAMSIGMNFRYGGFTYYTAGDMQGLAALPGKPRIDLEKDMALACRRVDVAKLNHHGCESMPRNLIAKLQARVFLNGTWDQAHPTPDTLERISDPSLYPGARTFLPGMLPRRFAADGAGPAAIADRAFCAGVHVVVDVPPGGAEYTVSAVTAADESMRTVAVRHFQSYGTQRERIRT